jgi:protein SCO1
MALSNIKEVNNDEISSARHMELLMHALRQRWVWLLAGVLVLGIGVSTWMLKAQRPEVPSWVQGMGGDFHLLSKHGPVSLHDFRGKVVLVYFGYTHCPDACPTALGNMGTAMQMLKGKERKQVAGVFISLDPRRDTPQVLAEYAHFFGKRIVGLTGSPDTLEKVAKAWRVAYSVPDAPADSDYAVEHSTFIYLVNPEGKVVDLFGEKTHPEEITRAIRSWLD